MSGVIERGLVAVRNREEFWCRNKKLSSDLAVTKKHNEKSPMWVIYP